MTSEIEYLKGEKGDQGLVGRQGPPGPQGEKGDKGDPGQSIIGPPGKDSTVPGPPGKDGKDGKDGAIGPRGPMGIRGEKGEKGDTGLDGRDGKDGKDGKDGLQGRTGIKGDKGAKGDRGPKGDKGDRGEQGRPGDMGPKPIRGIDYIVMNGRAGRDADTTTLVPYTGAATNVDLGIYGIHAATSSFGTSPNYTAFDSTGHQTMSGDAKPWRDELGDVLLLRQQGPGISTNVTDSTVEFTTASNLDDYLYRNVQLNHDKDLSSSLHPHIHFFQAQNNIPNFLFQYRWQVNGGSKVTGWTDLKCNGAAFPYTSGTIHQIAYSNPIAVPLGTTVSDIIQFRIIRDNAGTSTQYNNVADPYTTTVGVLSFDIHFQLNSVGSTDQYVK